MQNTFTPKTKLSQALLHAIPRKTYLWLKSLGVDVNVPGQHHLYDKTLMWHFDEEEMFGTLQLYVGDKCEASILWDLDLVEPKGTCSGIPLEEPVENLDDFVRIEHTLFELLGDLDAKLRAERNVKRPE